MVGAAALGPASPVRGDFGAVKKIHTRASTLPAAFFILRKAAARDLSLPSSGSGANPVFP